MVNRRPWDQVLFLRVPLLSFLTLGLLRVGFAQSLKLQLLQVPLKQGVYYLLIVFLRMFCFFPTSSGKFCLGYIRGWECLLSICCFKFALRLPNHFPLCSPLSKENRRGYFYFVPWGRGVVSRNKTKILQIYITIPPHHHYKQTLYQISCLL